MKAWVRLYARSRINLNNISVCNLYSPALTLIQQCATTGVFDTLFHWVVIQDTQTWRKFLIYIQIYDSFYWPDVFEQACGAVFSYFCSWNKTIWVAPCHPHCLLPPSAFSLLPHFFLFLSSLTRLQIRGLWTTIRPQRCAAHSVTRDQRGALTGTNQEANK